jgi:hypothetical protein
MAGYSGTPLQKKLGLRPKQRVAFLGAPAHFAELLGELPKDVLVLARPATDMDLIHAFTRSPADLERRFPLWARRLAPAGCLWISWPKKSSPLFTGLCGDDVRRIGLAAGLVDIKVCAVDEDWSGLKFVRRVADRR